MYIEGIIPEEILISKIYLVRGRKVLLDTDLAELYGVETRNLNKAVSRNIKRFPADFMFQLSDAEWKNLMSQSVTSSWGGTRKAPKVFTEEGVAMLSGVLSSDRAIMVNIQIMRTFTRIRQMLTDNTELRLAIQTLENKTDGNSKSIELLFEYMDELMEKEEKAKKTKPRKVVGFKQKTKK